jgi:predicted glycosyl hydrolase (DUF1957 family)
VPLDLNDPKVVKQLEADAKARAQMDADTLVRLMDTQSGRAFIWRSLESSHVFASSFTSDPLLMAFNEGQRVKGVELVTQLMKHCPKNYILMAEEANARDTAIERSISADGSRRDQGSDEYQLDLYRDLATGKISVEYEPGSDEAA